jgi:ankyrin repeat protein
VEWFGGERAYSGSVRPGIARAHHHLFVSPRGAAAWLRCMGEALQACGVAPAPVMRLLGPMAKAMVNRADAEPASLVNLCSFVQDAGAARLERAMADVVKGRTDALKYALAADPLLAQDRGLHGQSLLWLAVYKNRPEIVQLLLDAGADPNLPGCDPARGETASNNMRLGTIVSVTPLALALKLRRALAPLLVQHGAVLDIFTAAWLGDRASVSDFLDRHSELVNAMDPAEDFQQVTPLAHALAGGDIDVVLLLLNRGAEVRVQSGKLLGIAIMLNRPDLVQLLLERGADARTVDSLGPLGPSERPIADMLIAHGARVPSFMLSRACRADVSRNELHRVGVLLDYGADVNSRGREGLTALHYAVRSGKLPLIRLLLERGADVTARDPNGLTPVQHLTKTRAKVDHQSVIDLLAQYGALSSAGGIQLEAKQSLVV